MPRKPRVSSASGVYHFITRGVNKKTLFHRPQDFEKYLDLLMEYRDPCGLEIYHYCLMSNHIHLALKAPNLDSLARFAHFTHRRYAYYYYKTYNWSEQVFRRCFSSFPIEDDAYLMECGRYIERNPLDAKLVEKIEDYLYTSYSFYAYAAPNALLKKSPTYPTLGRTPLERRAAYQAYVSPERKPLKGGSALKLTVPF